MKRLLIGVMTVMVVLTGLTGAMALAGVQTEGAQPAGAQSTAPGAATQENPAADATAPSIQADSRTMAAPTIQFSLSISTVNFGSGSLIPQATPYTQTFTAAINSNMSWRISSTKDHDLQGTKESVPSSDFTFSAVGPAGSTTYQAPSGTQFGTDVVVVTGTRGGNLISTITYSLLVPWTVLADNYSATHTYTAMTI